MTQPARNTAPKKLEDAVKHIPETTLSAEQVRDFLIKARVKLLISAPFFGNLATRLNLIDATKWCPTLATDGKNFYYNRHFVAAMHEKDEGEVEFGFGHEVLHCVYDHMTRRNRDWDVTRDRKMFDSDQAYVDYLNDVTRQADLWNIANDYIINNDLVEARIGTKIETIKIIYDRKYIGFTSEEVYDDLVEQAEKNGNVTHQVPFDMHLDPQDGDGEDGEDGDANDGTNGPIRYTQEEQDAISNEVQSSVLQNARGEAGGNLPSGVKRLVDSYLNPQLNWRELLPSKIQSTIKSDYTYRRPSRKGIDAGFYLPSMDYDETIDIAVALDLSGSIDEAMSLDFLSEVKGCMEQYTNFKVHVFCFDTAVHNPQKFDENNIDEFLSYELVGGGGTDFDCCFNFMKDNNIHPKMFVMFTDGYPWNSWGDEDYCDTLFIVHGGGRGDVPQAPFGTTVAYSRET